LLELSPPDTPHHVKAISSGKRIVVDYPLLELPSTKAHYNYKMEERAFLISEAVGHEAGQT